MNHCLITVQLELNPVTVFELLGFNITVLYRTLNYGMRTVVDSEQNSDFRGGFVTRTFVLITNWNPKVLVPENNMYLVKTNYISARTHEKII